MIDDENDQDHDRADERETSNVQKRSRKKLKR